mmetsp:Transcript_10222/g.20445  ORF Transcript_10222/g.20445 Transcript_10222/m.20445 type:complete len:266 (+) Transcript_10222:124-921(+)
MSNSTSGMRQMSTSREARAACAARYPHDRPMTLTMPIPCRQADASIRAHFIALTASCTAVSKPNERSMTMMSLSMVFGTPTTAIFNPRRLISSVSSMAAACVPSPPMQYSWSNCISTILSTTFGASNPPLLEPRIVPPRLWILLTLFSVRTRGGHSSGSENPRKPPRMPSTFPSGTLYSKWESHTIPWMTVFKPGHKPPHVKIPIRVSSPLNKTLSRGPARVKPIGSSLAPVLTITFSRMTSPGSMKSKSSGFGCGNVGPASIGI